MSNLFITILVLIALACAAAGYVLLRRNISAKKSGRIITSDPAAQASYNKKYTPEENSLSLEEKIERSWQFLIDLREYVINKFSESDQEKIKKAGLKLASHSMKYQHDINTVGSLTVSSQEFHRNTKKDKNQVSR